LTVNIGAKVIGSLQPPNPALRGFFEGCENKRQPCWYGIVPSITTLDEGDFLLKQVGYEHRDTYGDYFWYRDDSQGCPVTVIHYNPDQIIYAVTLERCTLKLGDIAASLGIPDFVGERKREQTEIYVPVYNFQKYYIAYVTDFDAHVPVSYVSLRRYPRADTLHTWHGFVPLWRYCQLEPTLPTYLYCLDWT
jgi:hypothetical protein